MKEQEGDREEITPQAFSLPVGVYRHYKGGLYRVHAVGYLESTLEQVVIYQSLEDATDMPKGTFFVRPFFEFTEVLMTTEDQEVERFAYQSEYDEI